MKNAFIIFAVCICTEFSAQISSYINSQEFPHESVYSGNLTSLHISSQAQIENIEAFNWQEVNKPHAIEPYSRPSPPLLTTQAQDLELCTGNSARLTANSNHTIYWYTTPPPLGISVGTGSCYITPVLTTGYYTYYAIADNNGVKSDITAMEVVMVYPTPTISIASSANSLCANETATLTATGTSYFEWENGASSKQMVIHPTNTTTYKVTGINTAGCKSTVLYTQNVESCAIDNAIVTGINSLYNKNDELFSVYPNPNNGEFNIKIGEINENTRIEVYNSIGEQVFYSLVFSETTPVSLKNYAAGIYIVRIIENNKTPSQEKIVKE